MKNFLMNSMIKSSVVLLFFLLPFYQVIAKPLHDDKLSVNNHLTAETASVYYVAEGNETLTYSIVISNAHPFERTTSITETVPLGSSYAGGGDFSIVCAAGDVALTQCTLKNVVLPANGSVTLIFKVKVEDPVTTNEIYNSISLSDFDCTITTTCDASIVTAGIGSSTGFVPISNSDWNETSVRKVLFAFAYGGLATDAQITTWASMSPTSAIQEILTFAPTNELLSPAEDATNLHATNLETLQDFWSSDDPGNPARWDRKKNYAEIGIKSSGEKFISRGALRTTWIQAVNARGVNPFLHKMGFFLTNYHMAINYSSTRAGLFRSYYDQIITDLTNGEKFTTVIATAAKSAATARRYGNQYSSFNNNNMTFSGNDDFAREFFQLFFRYNGLDEIFDYHEGTNIENNSMLLTGMSIDIDPVATQSDDENEKHIAPINFTDHYDAAGRFVKNETNHHQACLEIFHQQVCGINASEKIDAVSSIVSVHPEVMASLPTFIINFFADDQLNANKISQLTAAWASANDNLLTFLQNYATSTTFHSEDTVKYRSTFDRNVALFNAVVTDNEEAFKSRVWYESAYSAMLGQGGKVFEPTHDVFGGQTGTEAADNPGIFKSAYDEATTRTTDRLMRVKRTYYDDESLTTQTTWEKDWVGTVPKNQSGDYVVGDVADWLWQRMVGDGAKNFDIVARSQVLAILARGTDFGYVVSDANPEVIYTSSQLSTDPDLVALINQLETETMDLESETAYIKRDESIYITYAANFISMLPYTFAMEGK